MFAVVNHADKKVIVSYKGTSRWQEIITHDVCIAAHTHIANDATANVAKAFQMPHRFNSALNFTKECLKYPGYEVVLTGHSLG